MFTVLSRRFGVSRSFPGKKLLDILILVSLLLASCGPQKTNSPTPETAQPTEAVEPTAFPEEQSDYSMPVFTRPEPRTTDHTDFDTSPVSPVDTDGPLMFTENSGRFDPQADFD